MMIASYLLLAYVVVLIVLANRDELQPARPPLTSFATFGLTQIEALWRLVEALVRHMRWGDAPGFDRRKPVHRVAALLMILQAVLVVSLLTMDIPPVDRVDFPGDLAGALRQIAGNAAIYLALALLGVGYQLRRNRTMVRRQLGLRRPTRADWLSGLAMAIALYALTNLGTTTWAALTPAETFTEQTRGARMIFQALEGSLLAGLFLAVVTATGEEILFRGALQPVLGILLSSLFFTLIHVQYAFTPAMLILCIVSLGFAQLRRRYSTTAAIIAHAGYNFLPFLQFALF